MELDYIEQSRDNFVIFINERIEQMPPIVEECSIFRVPKRLCEMKSNVYLPKVISIGPFHKERLESRAIEDLKIRFFNSYRMRVENTISIQSIVERFQKLEEKARKYYSEPIDMESEEFVKMMILDGCFIVEYLIKDLPFFYKRDKVHLSTYKAISLDIGRDLIMLENQLPYFILQLLFNLLRSSILIETPYDIRSLFKHIVDMFLNDCVLPVKIGDLSNVMLDDIDQNPLHLLDFLSFYFVKKKNISKDCQLHELVQIQQKKEYVELFKNGAFFSNMWFIIKNPHHLVDFLSFYFVAKTKKNMNDKREYLPPSATRLREAGVVFKKVEGSSTYIMDISFKNGILNIPPLRIDDRFETCARNLLAFSQFIQNEDAIHFFKFLDELISTEKDVNILVEKGIILNHIGGSDKEIAELFNDLCKDITRANLFSFSEISKDLQDHCGRKWNKWKATLRHNYFNTPWAHISFWAATFLILLTLLQTIFAGISTF